ncbi:MAG: 30S ribosomal protein S13, partial [Bdellovibrionales bacterium]|nr:30S ribosomal protein S13 [Bdellovibrionales bacterium]
MARLAGVDLPRNKRVEIALTYIYGIGRKRSKAICTEVGIPAETRTEGLTDQHIAKIREIIERQFAVEGDLRRNIAMAVKRLMDLGCFRGVRHRKG